MLLYSNVFLSACKVPFFPEGCWMLVSDIFVLVEDKIVTFGEVQTDADYLDGIEVLRLAVECCWGYGWI